MKIKPIVNKNVTSAVENCHKVIVRETIGLLKQMGVESGQDVLFGKMLFLYQHNGNKTETVICDRIAYLDNRSGIGYICVSAGRDNSVRPVSDIFLSISNLRVIYEEVRRVVRESYQ